MKENVESYLALSGGIGGAKLTLGLDRLMDPRQLAILTNTGDDFEHLGLYISPDIDTTLYTLSALNNRTLGWGREDESWNFMEVCEQLGMESWFRLGDRDLALHLYRTTKLKEGQTLSEITRHLCRVLDLQSTILPMSNSPVRTILETAQGTMSFQEYFVRNQCEPAVLDIWYRGANDARPVPELDVFLENPKLKAVIIGPSNPFLSIGPILAVCGMREKLRACGKPVLVVSPLINGQAVKGPTVKIMQELGHDCSVLAIAEIYKDIATHFIVDNGDSDLVPELSKTGMEISTADIFMNTDADKIRLAKELLELSNEAGSANTD